MRQSAYLLWLGVVLLLSGTPLLASPVGSVTTVAGEAWVVRAGEQTREPLAVRMDIFLNDIITTSASGRVKLLLNDNNVLQVSPSSQLRLSSMLVGKTKGGKSVVDLMKGKLRSLVGKRLGATSKFEVHTSVAVAGVRGTDFLVWVRADGTTVVRVFEGMVELKNSDPGVAGSVMVRANSYSVVKLGEPPQAPLGIEPQSPLPGERPGELLSDELQLDEAELRGLEQTLDTLLDSDLGREVEMILLLRSDNNLYGASTEDQVDAYPYPVIDAVAAPLTVNIPTP